MMVFLRTKATQTDVEMLDLPVIPRIGEVIDTSYVDVRVVDVCYKVRAGECHVILLVEPEDGAARRFLGEKLVSQLL